MRVTGPIALDCGHGLTSPCYETDNDPGNTDTKNLEIHPLYSIEILQDFTAPRASNIDLTGSWAALDVGTYYVRQIGNTIWWLGLSRDQGLTFANVFHGILQSSVIVTGGGTTTTANAEATSKVIQPPGFTPVITGQWASLPLGSTQGDGSLTLSGKFCTNIADATCINSAPGTAWNVLSTQTSSSPLFANPPNSSFQWQKLYDWNQSATPQIIVPQTLVMGTVANGSEATTAVPVRNIGTTPLVIQSITSSLRALTFSPTTLTLAPGASGLVNVQWLVTTTAATGTQAETGYLTLKSNDPASPTVSVTLQVSVRGGPIR